MINPILSSKFHPESDYHLQSPKFLKHQVKYLLQNLLQHPNQPQETHSAATKTTSSKVPDQITHRANKRVERRHTRYARNSAGLQSSLSVPLRKAQTAAEGLRTSLQR